MVSIFFSGTQEKETKKKKKLVYPFKDFSFVLSLENCILLTKRGTVSSNKSAHNVCDSGDDEQVTKPKLHNHKSYNKPFSITGTRLSEDICLFCY